MNKITAVALVLVTMLAFANAPALAQPVTTELSPIADTFLHNGNLNANEGASPMLRVRASGKNRAMVRFDQDEINALVGGGVLISATLELFIADNADNWGDGRNVDVHRMLIDWAEGNGKTAGLPGPERYRGDGPGATWWCPVDPDISNFNDDDADRWLPGEPARFQGGNFDPTPTDNIIVVKELLGWVSWDVTADVAAYLGGSEANFGWLVKKTNEGLGGLVDFSSREGANPPRLVITYSPSDLEASTLFSDMDTFLRSGAPDTNEGANPGLRIQASGNNRLLVGFDLSAVDLTGLVKATLVLTLLENTDNWGPAGDRTIDVHRLLSDWEEGNGKLTDIPLADRTRGTGPGATWWTPVDPNITNSNDDGSAPWKPALPVSQQGGFYAPATAPSKVLFNGLMGTMTWDVTQDVLDGAEVGWLIKKTSENLSGKAIFYSREGAAEAADPNLAPQLILEYSE